MFWRKPGKSKDKFFVIAGLGNPGDKYQATRHNAGYLAVDRLMDRYGTRLTARTNEGLCGKGTIDGRKVLLVKPLTFMNESGRCIRRIVDFYKLDPSRDLVILYDDVDLSAGSMRVRAKGSAGSHNGMKSIISHLGTQEFARIRIGIGAPPAGADLVNWVLGKIPKAEIGLIRDVCDQICDAVPMIMEGDVQGAMNRYNRKG